MLEEIVVNKDKRLNSTMFIKNMIPAQEKISTQGRNKKLENKVKILNPTPSNMDMGVLSGYVQTKRHLWGKSQ